MNEVTYGIVFLDDIEDAIVKQIWATILLIVYFTGFTGTAVKIHCPGKVTSIGLLLQNDVRKYPTCGIQIRSKTALKNHITIKTEKHTGGFQPMCNPAFELTRKKNFFLAVLVKDISSAKNIYFNTPAAKPMRLTNPPTV